MPALASELRTRLERTIIQARAAAESGARAALDALAVKRNEPFPTMTPEARRLRNALRARARQLGNGVQADGFEPLVEEVAYEQWHRMLFARFLAENGLLMHPVRHRASRWPNAPSWPPKKASRMPGSLAARYAGPMLPGIFRADDPSAQVRFTPEGRQSLEAILAGLPAAVFTADDALGWVYQFWQAKRRMRSTPASARSAAPTCPPVTQLFTEDYMVRFLLENSLGAWWAARHPDSPLVKTFEYLRYRDDGTPAAGTFPGWPDRAAKVTCMDPCGGSGHFVVAEFDMLRRMRMEEEGLIAGRGRRRGDPRQPLHAGDRPALHADRRVCAGVGCLEDRRLPAACRCPTSPAPASRSTGQLDDWLRLAGGDERLRTALERLYKLFRDAPTLGSLINPADVP